MSHKAWHWCSLILLFATCGALHAGDDGKAYLGHWRGPARFGTEQAIIIDKPGGQWFIVGIVFDKGRPLVQFYGKDIKFDAEKGLTFKEDYKLKTYEPAQVTLLLKDKSDMRAVTLLDNKKAVEFALKKTGDLAKKEDPGKKPIVQPGFPADDIAKVEGSWQGKLESGLDVLWTFRRIKDEWSVVGVIKKGDEEIAYFNGEALEPRPKTKDIGFRTKFDPAVPGLGAKIVIINVQANDKQLSFVAFGQGTEPQRGLLNRAAPGVEVALNKPVVPKKVKGDTGVDLPGAGGTTGLAFTSDGKQLVVANQRGSVHVMNVADEKVVLTLDAHKDGVSALALSPNGKTIATGGRDKLVKLWDFESGKLLQTFEGFNRHVTAVAFSADSKLIAAAEQFATLTGQPSAKVMIWQTGGKLSTMFSSDASGVAFTPDGKMLLSNGGKFTNPKMPGQTTFTIQFWSVAGKLAGAVPGNVGIIYKVRCSGNQIAWSGENNQVLVFNRTTNKMQFTLPVNERYIQDLAFTSDGSKLVTLAEKGVVRVWDMKTGKQIATNQDHDGPVRHLAISPDGTRYAVGGSGQPHVAVYALPGKK